MTNFFKHIFLITLFACLAGHAHGAPLKIERFTSPRSLGSGIEVIAERVNLQLKPGYTLADADAGLAALGMSRDIWLENIRFIRVVLPENMKVADGIAALSSQPWAEYPEPDRIYKKNAIAADPYFHSQYGLASISAPAGWEYQTGSTAVIIAIMDTGVNASHPDIAGRISSDKNVWFDMLNGSSSNPENPPTDCDGHGTHVAGIAGAGTNNGIGMAGVSWSGEVVSLRIFQANIFSCESVNDANIAAAMNYAGNLAQSTGRRVVVNMSLGSVPTSDTDPCSNTLRTAVTSALNKNVVLVAAAGNYLTPDPTVGKAVCCPARIPGVIAVGSIDEQGIVDDWSARGSQLSVTAPGDTILSLDSASGGYMSLSGTSMASPFVTGLASLVLAAKPSASTSTIINWIQQGSDPVGSFNTDYGYGRLNNYKTLRLAITGTKTDSHADVKATAFPNPFRPGKSQMLTFLVPDSINGAEPKIKIYNMNGELVRTLYTMSWDGTNDAGNPAASGVYIFKVETTGGKGTGRLAIIR